MMRRKKRRRRWRMRSGERREGERERERERIDQDLFISTSPFFPLIPLFLSPFLSCSLFFFFSLLFPRPSRYFSLFGNTITYANDKGSSEKARVFFLYIFCFFCLIIFFVSLPLLHSPALLFFSLLLSPLFFFSVAHSHPSLTGSICP